MAERESYNCVHSKACDLLLFCYQRIRLFLNGWEALTQILMNIISQLFIRKYNLLDVMPFPFNLALDN